MALTEYELRTIAQLEKQFSNDPDGETSAPRVPHWIRRDLEMDGLMSAQLALLGLVLVFVGVAGLGQLGVGIAVVGFVLILAPIERWIRHLTDRRDNTQ